jgi:hypothetical protein
MRLAIATLADAANVREGLLSVLSAGVTIVRRPSFPARLEVVLAISVEVAPEDRIAELDINADVRPGAPGATVAEGEAPLFSARAHVEFELERDSLFFIPLAIPLGGATVPSPGAYRIVVGIPGLADTEVPFGVVAP